MPAGPAYPQCLLAAVSAGCGTMPNSHMHELFGVVALVGSGGLRLETTITLLDRLVHRHGRFRRAHRWQHLEQHAQSVADSPSSPTRQNKVAPPCRRTCAPASRLWIAGGPGRVVAALFAFEVGTLVTAARSLIRAFRIEPLLLPATSWPSRRFFSRSVSKSEGR